MLERAATLGAEHALQQLKPEVDTQGVAQMLGVSSRTVARMEARGELPPRIGRHWNRRDIETFRAHKRTKS